MKMSTEAIVIPADVGDATTLRGILESAVDKHGDIDLLVNNGKAEGHVD